MVIGAKDEYFALLVLEITIRSSFVFFFVSQIWEPWDLLQGSSLGHSWNSPTCSLRVLARPLSADTISFQLKSTSKAGFMRCSARVYGTYIGDFSELHCKSCG